LRSSSSGDAKAETISRTVSPVARVPEIRTSLTVSKDERFVGEGGEGIMIQEAVSCGRFSWSTSASAFFGLRVFFRFPQPQKEPLQEGLMMRNIQNVKKRIPAAIVPRTTKCLEDVILAFALSPTAKSLTPEVGESKEFRVGDGTITGPKPPKWAAGVDITSRSGEAV